MNAQLDRIEELIEDVESGAIDPGSSCARISELLLDHVDRQRPGGD
jgi:hypothetical protein